MNVIPKMKVYNRKLKLKFTASLPCSSKKSLSSFFTCQKINGAITPPRGKKYPANADM